MSKRRAIQPYFMREVSADSVLAVLGGGKVSFELPREWKHRVKDTGLAAYDREPPGNDCILEATLIRHPPGPIRDLPLWKMLQDGLSRQGTVIPREEIAVENRGEIQIARVQYQDIHPKHDRVAVFCCCYIRGSGFHALLSYAYWPEHAERLVPVWTRAIESFEVGIPPPRNPDPN